MNKNKYITKYNKNANRQCHIQPTLFQAHESYESYLIGHRTLIVLRCKPVWSNCHLVSVED